MHAVDCVSIDCEQVATHYTATISQPARITGYQRLDAVRPADLDELVLELLIFFYLEPDVIVPKGD